MLRLLVAALLIANLLFWAWHQPAVSDALGWAPPADAGREPQRLQRQVRPEAVRLLPASEAVGRVTPVAPSVATPLLAALPDALPDAAVVRADMPAGPAPSDSGVCLETGPMNDAAASAAERALAQAGVPASAWTDVRRELPGRWIVYMGRYAEREVLQRKLEEVQRLNISATELRSPGGLAPGLALGEFGTQADAQARLERLQARGVRSARVLQLPSRGAEHRLRAERLDRRLAEQLAAWPPARGQARWQPCA
jgi:hypothetical protein